ncbi:Lrp/AsnC family transcriptional regulator [Egicoccus halophilus]|uniref:AsnC family transcriptional regulator n=1 Tax=Egicoccus halophilus TaxID=1670830 RepID=A0A8J3A593_9ACTN|nr:Lrp/AsnC family transcriptional regulator [Egicoccus halophilus]GGI03339.1 AsnC family transcriptional regulator [Egicoccus halophilus]
MFPLDRTDRVLLHALQADGRATVKELGAAAGLSPSAAHERVRRLQRAGVVTGVHAALDPSAVGIGLQALIQVQLTRHSRETLASFREHALSLPETLAVAHVTGAMDFLVRVGVRDSDHLRDLALDAFTTRPEVARLETAIVYEHVLATHWPVVTRDER